LYYNAGNVGIGTTAPNALLQINSASASANRLTSLYISTPAAGIILDSTSSTGGRSYNIWSTTSGDSVGTGGLAIFDQTSSAYRIAINSSGSVGIKTSTPVAVLDTVGTIRSLDATYAALSAGTGLELYYSGGGNIVSGTRNAGSLTTAALGYIASTHSFNVGTGGGTNGLFITSTGTVGINTTTTGAYTLNVTGSIYATGDITALSDKRKKDNIIPLTQSLDLLTQLTGYSYTRSDLKDKENIGLIAQEVKEVFPQAVTYDDELELYSLNYGCLIAPVIQAIKELKQTVNKLQEKVDKQDAIIQIFLDHYGPPQ
jgi:hypothetical protein